MQYFWVNINYVNINSRFWHNMSFAAWRHSGRCRRLRGCQWAQWHAWTWYHHPWCPHACCKHKFRSCKHKFGISTYWIWNLLDDGILGAVGGSVDSVNSLACLHAIPITPNGPTHAVNINSDLVNINSEVINICWMGLLWVMSTVLWTLWTHRYAWTRYPSPVEAPGVL